MHIQNSVKHQILSITDLQFSPYSEVIHGTMKFKLMKILKILLIGVKPKDLHFFTKKPLQRTVQHLIKCFYFEVGNHSVLQTTGIPIGIDLVSFWAHLYLSKLECDIMSKLTRKNFA